jgi:hypothetical protein
VTALLHESSKVERDEGLVFDDQNTKASSGPPYERFLGLSLRTVGNLPLSFSALLCGSSVLVRLLAVMLPVKPINSFGKRQPMSRNVFELLFEAQVGHLCGASFGHQSASAIIFSAQVHPNGSRKCQFDGQCAGGRYVPPRIPATSVSSISWKRLSAVRQRLAARAQQADEGASGTYAE